MLICFLYKYRQRRKQLGATWLLEHTIPLGLLLPPHRLLPSQFPLLAPLPPSQSLSVGRSQGLVLSIHISISILSPVTSPSHPCLKFRLNANHSQICFQASNCQIQTYIPNCLFSSASPGLAAISKGTGQVGQITT